MSVATQSLSNLQLELPKLFSRKVADNDLLEIKQILLKYFAEKAMDEADKVWLEQGLTDIDAKRIAHEHLRVPYNQE